MPTSDLNNISTQQVPVGSQFDRDRYAVYFEPCTYGSAADPLVFQVGYYTEVAGLGATPQATVIDGAIDMFNNLCTAGTDNCNSDVNFWRSMSNLTLNVDFPSSPPSYAPPVLDPDGPGCANSEESWSASQADPIRRVIVNGNVVLQDTCASEDYASGGYIADSQINGDLDFWTGQHGTDVFFQNELPYDPPSQSAWRASPTQDGYPAFLVGRHVTSFRGYGMGSYVVFISTPATLHDAEAFQAPDTPGVRFTNIFAVWIAGSGGDNSIINGTGGPVTSTNPGTVEPVDLASYP